MATALTARSALGSRWTLISGVAAMAVASLQFGIAVGPMIIALLYAHELGHILTALWRRVPVEAAPLFIPGLGAFVAVEPTDRIWDAVLIYAGGPIIGGAAALAASLTGSALNLPALAVAGQIGLLLNLFNLLPFNPLDGGQIVSRVGWFGLIPTFLVVVLNLLVAALSLLVPNLARHLHGPLVAPTRMFGHFGLFLTVLLIAGLWASYTRLREDPHPPWRTGLAILAFYVLLAASVVAAVSLAGGAPNGRSPATLSSARWFPNPDMLFLGLLIGGAIYLVALNRDLVVGSATRIGSRLGVPLPAWVHRLGRDVSDG